MDNFDRFWSAYPKKKAKGAAKKAFEKALNESDEEDLTKVVVLAIDAQKREKRRLKEAKQFVPEWKYPATWLNQQCWYDEVITSQEIEEKRQETFCQCGKESTHGKYCQTCFQIKLDDETGWTKRLREEYLKLPKKRKDETYQQWAFRIGWKR